MSGESTVGDECECDARLGELLLGVVDEARVPDVLMPLEGSPRGIDLTLRGVEQLGRPLDLVTVKGPDGVAARPDRTACRCQSALACLGLGIELRSQICG